MTFHVIRSVRTLLGVGVGFFMAGARVAITLCVVFHECSITGFALAPRGRATVGDDRVLVVAPVNNIENVQNGLGRGSRGEGLLSIVQREPVRIYIGNLWM